MTLGAASFALFAKGAVFDFLNAKTFPVISLESSTCKFTIDKTPILRYAFACCLEERSPTPHATLALTLDGSTSCSLLPVFFRRPSFVFNHLQPLLAKHPGGGILLHLALVESAIYSRFLPNPVATWLTPPRGLAPLFS